MNRHWLTRYAEPARNADGGAGGGGAAAAAGGAGAADAAGAAAAAAAAGGAAAGAAAGAAGAGAAGAAGVPADPPARPWIETVQLAPELKSALINNGFHKAKGEDGQPRDATPEEALAKALGAYDAAQRKLGMSPDQLLPAPKAPDDADWWKAHGARLGVPEAPDKYGIERPKLPDGMPWDEGFEKAALERFHAAGMPKRMAAEAVGVFAEHMGKMWTSAAAESTAAKAAMLQELQADWGAQTNTRLGQAARAFQAIAAEAGIKPEEQQGFAAALSTQLGGDARAIRFMHAIYAKMGEDRMPGGTTPGGGFGAGLAPVEAQARLDAIKAPGGDWARARNDPKRQGELRAEMAQLAKIIAPPAAR